MQGRPSAAPDPIVLARDSVTAINAAIESGKNDEETLELIERNVAHLELILEAYEVLAETKADFEAAILAGKAVIN